MPKDRKPQLVVHEDPLALCNSLLAQLPSLHEDFKPIWLLPNGHVQTIMTHAMNIVPRHVVYYHRQLVELSDGGTVSLDWATLKKSRISLPTILNQTNQLTIVLMHGLGGGSHESYIQLTAKCCLEAGYRVVVMNARGCAATPVTTPKLVCPAFTSDVKEVVAHLREKYVPMSTPLIAIGYSLGANILLKYVGEEGTNCLLTAAISLANPYDLVLTTAHLANSWWHRQIYNKALTSGLVKLVFKKSDAHKILKRESNVNLKQLSKSRILEDFDKAYSCQVFGYATPLDIYKDASSTQYINTISIPTLCISSLDDPICPKEAIPYEECRSNPNVILAVTKNGGHLGYYTKLKFNTWYIDTIIQFSKAIEQTMPPKSTPNPLDLENIVITPHN
ncbi:serine protease family S33 [Thraustotheca clavata]|uniref:Serine protease family S33 n=1 Tax=Thraustotheca clavata TaxID=74557 RepID=A0A1V9ZD59_9STRA|nr:serine protease family S33 [Thraustotheca clavata]